MVEDKPKKTRRKDGGRNRRLPDVLNMQEIEILINGVSNPTHQMAFALMAYAGLRVSEAQTLHTSNIFMSKNYLQIIGKGNKERKVPISVPLKKLLQEYIARHQKEAGPLITISVRSIQKALNFYGAKILNRKLNPHLLRHSFATILFAHDVPIEKIGRILGHDSITTTLIYTHSTIEVSQKAIAVLNQKKTFKDRLKSILTDDKYQDYSLRFKQNRIMRGRESELALINDYIQKKVSMVLYGKPGVGKSFLAEHLENKILIKSFQKKESIIEILINLTDNQNNIEEMKKFLGKQPIDDLCKLIGKMQPTVIIDNLNRITKAEEKIIKKLHDNCLLIITTTSTQENILRLCHTAIEIKPLSKDQVRQIIYEMVFIPKLEEKAHFINTILSKADRNLNEAIFLINQANLGIKIENVTTDVMRQRMFSVGPFMFLAVFAYLALIIKHTTVSYVTFSIIAFWILRLLFNEFIWKPSMKKRKQQ